MQYSQDTPQIRKYGMQVGGNDLRRSRGSNEGINGSKYNPLLLSQLRISYLSRFS